MFVGFTRVLAKFSGCELARGLDEHLLFFRRLERKHHDPPRSRFSISPATVREAANNTSVSSALKTGMRYIAECSPWPRNGSRLLAPAAAAALRVKKSLAIPVASGPNDAPNTYIAKKYSAIAVPRSDGSTTSCSVA